MKDLETFQFFPSSLRSGVVMHAEYREQNLGGSSHANADADRTVLRHIRESILSAKHLFTNSSDTRRIWKEMVKPAVIQIALS